jgi:plastocyanin
MIRSIRPILLAFAMVGLVACGGDDDGGDDGGGDDGGEDAVEIIPVADCPSDIAEEVTTSGMAYVNPTFTISAGDVVKFTPSGMHDMKSTGSGFAWDTGPLNQAACIKFNTAGTYPYECDQHPAMVGVITVSP